MENLLYFRYFEHVCNNKIHINIHARKGKLTLLFIFWYLYIARKLHVIVQPGNGKPALLFILSIGLGPMYRNKITLKCTSMKRKTHHTFHDGIFSQDGGHNTTLS